MSQFYLASPSSSPSRQSSPHGTDTPVSTRQSRTRQPYNLPYTSDSDDDLPYPQPLDRTSFLSSNFDPTTYLSTLRNRHQTLSDLRTELQSRISSLQTELLDLVNDEYASFLGLGKDLKGGEERVESVRVGIMGFVKGVEGVRGVVTERRLEVEGLIRQRREVFGKKEAAVGLLGVWEGVEGLERGLGISERGKIVEDGQGNGAADTKSSRTVERRGVNDPDSDDEESADEQSDLDYDEDLHDEDGGDDDDAADTFNTSTTAGTMSINKLQRLVRSYAGLRRTIHNIGSEHPFLQSQQPRLETIRTTLLLDLGAALKAASSAIGPVDVNQQRLLKIVGLYGEMDEGRAGVQVLKSLKSQ